MLWLRSEETKQLFSNTLKNPTLQAILEVNKYIEKRNGRKKLFVKLNHDK